VRFRGIFRTLLSDVGFKSGDPGVDARGLPPLLLRPGIRGIQRTRLLDLGDELVFGRS
jgi:hypothetical protein